MKKNSLNQCYQRSFLSSCELSPNHSKVLPEPLNTFDKKIPMSNSIVDILNNDYPHCLQGKVCKGKKYLLTHRISKNE